MGFSEPIELKQPVIYTRSNPNHGFTLTLQLPDQIFYSPYCQLHNSYDFSSENLVLDQLIIPN